MTNNINNRTSQDSDATRRDLNAHARNATAPAGRPGSPDRGIDHRVRVPANPILTQGRGGRRAWSPAGRPQAGWSRCPPSTGPPSRRPRRGPMLADKPTGDERRMGPGDAGPGVGGPEGRRVDPDLLGIPDVSRVGGPERAAAAAAQTPTRVPEAREGGPSPSRGHHHHGRHRLMRGLDRGRATTGYDGAGIWSSPTRPQREPRQRRQDKCAHKGSVNHP